MAAPRPAPRSRTRATCATDGGYFVQQGPEQVREQLHPAAGRLDAALARRRAADASGGLRAPFALRRRPRLAARLRRPRAVLPEGRVRARRGRRRRRPGPSRGGVRRAATTTRCAGSRRATPTRCSPRPSTAWRSRSGGEQFALKVRNYPAARNSHSARRLHPGRRRRRAHATARHSAAISDSGARATPRARRSARSRPSTTRRRRSRSPTAATFACSPRPSPRRSTWTRSAETSTSVEYQRYEDPDSPRHTVHRADGPDLRARGARGGEREADARLGPRRGERPARQEPDGPPVPVRLGPDAVAGRRLPRAAVDGRHGRSPGRARSAPQHAAFRFDIGNDGWRATTGRARQTVADAVNRQKPVRGAPPAPSGRHAFPADPLLAGGRAAPLGGQPRHRSIRGTSTRWATRGR